MNILRSIAIILGIFIAVIIFITSWLIKYVTPIDNLKLIVAGTGVVYITLVLLVGYLRFYRPNKQQYSNNNQNNL